MTSVVSLHERSPGSDSLAPKGLTSQSEHAAAWRAQNAKGAALKALSSLPPFSPVLNKLIATLADEDVSFTQVAALIEKDTVIAGHVLRLVNSALYARSGAVNSVGHALSILGMVKLRNAVLGMSIAKMWNQVRTPQSWSMARFNMHAAATAILCDILAQRVPVEYPEGAFLAGLMHDLGRLLIAIGLPAQFNSISEKCPDDSFSFQYELEALGFAHPELSAEALRLWKLPEPIQFAVRDHHTEVSPSPNGAIALSAVVSLANRYVNGLGISISLRPSPQTENPFSSIGVGAQQQDAILADFQNEYAEILPFFK